MFTPKDVCTTIQFSIRYSLIAHAREEPIGARASSAQTLSQTINAVADTAYTRQLRLDRSRFKKVAACNLLAWETEFGRVFDSELYQHPIDATTASLYVNDLISFDE